MNYSLLVMESAGMMKMATCEGSPLRQGAGTGSRLVFGGYRGLRRRNSRSIVLLDVLGYMDIYRRKKSVRGATRGPRGWGCAQGGRAHLPPSWMTRDSSGLLFCSGGFFCSIKISTKTSMPIGLRLVFLFCKTQKQGKNGNWHWALG